MDIGKHSGHGCVMLLYYKLCENIWEGSPATQQLTQQLVSSLESGDVTATLQADGDADIATASSESPTDTSGKEGDVSNNDSLTESQSLHVKQRRNLLDNKLNNYKQEKLKRKLSQDGQLLEYAKEDIEMKKRLVNHIEIMEEHYQDNMAKMSANMEKLSYSIGAGFSILQGLLVTQQNMLSQQQMCGMLSLPTSANFYNPYSQHVIETPEISGM